MGLPVDQDTMEELKEQSDAMKADRRGNYDFFQEKDRWQFLSKELS